jgi:hypothetical protein
MGKIICLGFDRVRERFSGLKNQLGFEHIVNNGNKGQFYWPAAVFGTVRMV